MAVAVLRGVGMGKIKNERPSDSFQETDADLVCN